MKKIALILILCGISLVANAGNLSAGLFLGYPNAINVRLDMGETSAVDAYLGWDYNGLYAAADYVLRQDLVFEGITLKLYYGAGAQIAMHSYTSWDWDASASTWRWVDHTDFHIGLRGKIGVSYFLPDTPIELYIEAGPGVTFVPSFSVTGIGGAGFRYHF